MGFRKKNNQATQQKRVIARKKRNTKRIKRAAKPKTPGQKLHDVMHGRA